MNEEYWAHKDQPLPVHLLGVAKRADQFGKFFNADGQAYHAGLLHDLGKAEDEFLKRICGDKGKEEPHAHHGAALVLEDTSRGCPIWPTGTSRCSRRSQSMRPLASSIRPISNSAFGEAAVPVTLAESTAPGSPWPRISSPC